MKRRWRLWLGLALLFLVAGWMVAPSVYWRGLGWWRGEAFYLGRPSRYWETEIRDRYSGLVEGSLPNNPVLFSLPTWWEQLFDKVGVYQPVSITKPALLEGDPEGIPVLLELLRSPDPKCRQVAVIGLGLCHNAPGIKVA